MWGNPSLTVSQSVTTKWTGLTRTVGVVGCLILKGDVFLEVSTWQSEQEPYRQLLFCEIVFGKTENEKLAQDDRGTHFLKLARSLKEAHSCCFQTNCFAQIRNEQNNHLSQKQAFTYSHWKKKQKKNNLNTFKQAFFSSARPVLEARKLHWHRKHNSQSGNSTEDVCVRDCWQVCQQTFLNPAVGAAVWPR